MGTALCRFKPAVFAFTFAVGSIVLISTASSPYEKKSNDNHRKASAVGQRGKIPVRFGSGRTHQHTPCCVLCTRYCFTHHVNHGQTSSLFMFTVCEAHLMSYSYLLVFLFLLKSIPLYLAEQYSLQTTAGMCLPLRVNERIQGHATAGHGRHDTGPPGPMFKLDDLRVYVPHNNNDQQEGGMPNANIMHTFSPRSRRSRFHRRPTHALTGTDILPAVEYCCCCTAVP